MKLKGLIIALAAINGLAATAGSKAVWLDVEHDFGAFDECLGVVSCMFRAVNTGDEPLVILNARANCGCTTPHFSDRPVMPGDTARVTVGYDATGRPGKFRKNVVVTTNANPAKETLTVCGTVIGSEATLQSRYPINAGPMKLRSDVITYGEVCRNSTAGQYIEAYNSLNDTLHPRVVKTPEHISVTVSPAAVPPGENFVVSTVFDPVKARCWDLINDTITIHAGGREVVLNTMAVVTEDFSHLTPAQLDAAPQVRIEPEILDAGRIMLGSKPITFVVRVYNRGLEPLKLRRVYSAHAGNAVSLNVKKQTVRPGKHEKIIVKVDPAQLADTDMLNSKIIIVTNDPAQPRLVLRLVGEIVPDIK